MLAPCTGCGSGWEGLGAAPVPTERNPTGRRQRHLPAMGQIGGRRRLVLGSGLRW